MISLLLIGFAMLGLSVGLSIAEFNHYWDAVNTHKIKAFGAIVEIKKLMPFAIDIVVTVFLSTFLGFGTGITGAITGIFAANVISCYIWYRGHIKNHITV